MNRRDHELECNEVFDAYSDTSASGAYEGGQNAEAAEFEHPCFELKKLLSGGTFYYSVVRILQPGFCMYRCLSNAESTTR